MLARIFFCSTTLSAIENIHCNCIYVHSEPHSFRNSIYFSERIFCWLRKLPLLLQLATVFPAPHSDIVTNREKYLLNVAINNCEWKDGFLCVFRHGFTKPIYLMLSILLSQYDLKRWSQPNQIEAMINGKPEQRTFPIWSHHGNKSENGRQLNTLSSCRSPTSTRSQSKVKFTAAFAISSNITITTSIYIHLLTKPLSPAAPLSTKQKKQWLLSEKKKTAKNICVFFSLCMNENEHSNCQLMTFQIDSAARMLMYVNTVRSFTSSTFSHLRI